jgi:zinc/manganese transport system permease protein
MGNNLGILLPAALTGLLVLATHVPLGQLVLARGIVFIDIALAQVAALGAVAGHGIFEGEFYAVQICATAAALLTAAFLTWTERRAASSQEAVIGVVYVSASAAQILLLSFDPHGAEHLKDLLVGQILWVSSMDLFPVAILYTLVLAALFRARLEERRLLFYAVFALTITASVQLIGVLLVFASLILPALAAGRYRTRPWRLIAGYAVGIAGYGAGLAISVWTDAPTGAAIVCTLTSTAALTAGIPLLTAPFSARSCR